MDLKNIHSIHFVGIKGVAMTALAIIAKELGIRVTGSDTNEVFPTNETLHKFNISFSEGFSPDHVGQIDLVIYTGAHRGIQNLEVKAAILRGIPVLPHGKALGLFMQGKRGISVAGSHGKTTTSALIAHLLTKLGEDPSYAIGCGTITSLGTPAHAGKGDFFVAEADEYVTDPVADPTPRFLWQHPEIAVITNIDFDHPDVFKSIAEVKMAFATFIGSMPDNAKVILNGDDPVASSLKKNLSQRIITYGSSPADFTFGNIKIDAQESTFAVSHMGKSLGEFRLSIPGKHNVANTTAAIATLVELGIAPEKMQVYVPSFKGTKRRFERIAGKNGKLLYDDYAHHPAEIAATLKAARSWFPKSRIVVIFQPHTYSRTKALLDQFAQSFKDADVVVLTDIYASAREKPIAGFSGETLYAKTKLFKKDLIYAPNQADVVKYISTQSRENDVIVTMGAGDIFSWLTQLKDAL